MPTPTTADRLRTWVDRGLKANGHPPLATIVRRARRQKPRPVAWAKIAADVSALSGESVSYEALRTWFADLDTEASQ